MKKMENHYLSVSFLVRQQLHPSQSIAPQDNGITRKMKTTEKHSQLNEFRVGCAQQSGNLFLEWTINLNKD